LHKDQKIGNKNNLNGEEIRKNEDEEIVRTDVRHVGCRFIKPECM
jgi:hypothetical protein